MTHRVNHQTFPTYLKKGFTIDNCTIVILKFKVLYEGNIFPVLHVGTTSESVLQSDDCEEHILFAHFLYRWSVNSCTPSKK